MTDPNEMAALRASLRGALSTSDALGGFRERVEALEPSTGPDLELLQDLARVAAAHAVASAALRGFVATMLERRGAERA